MTKAEAKQAMKDGTKVTHILFSPNEYITYNQEGKLIDEKGYELPEDVFWKYRKGETWEDNWTVAKPVFV